MKQKIAALFLFIMILLSACKIWTPGSKDNITFYYSRKEYAYGSQDAIFSSEIRDMAGHTTDTTYLLKMFLLGPLTEGLEAPFPQNTRLLSLQENRDETVITLSDAGASMPEIQFTLGCTSLAKTYIGIRDISQITVIRGSQSITLTRSGILLYDQSTGQSNREKEGS